MLTRPRRRAADDRGVTLTELVVAMTLGTILGTATLIFFVRSTVSATSTTDRAISTAQARSVLQSWSTYLHVADDPTASGLALNRFEWFGPNNIAFHSDINNRDAATNTTSAPQLVWLRLDGAGQLVEELFSSTPASYPANPMRCRVLTGPVSAGPLFTAFNSAGTSLSGLNLGTPPTVASGCTPLTAAVPSQQSRPDAVAVANLQNISSVSIAFTARDLHGAHPVGFQTVVAVPVLGALS